MDETLAYGTSRGGRAAELRVLTQHRAAGVVGAVEGALVHADADGHRGCRRRPRRSTGGGLHDGAGVLMVAVVVRGCSLAAATAAARTAAGRGSLRTTCG